MRKRMLFSYACLSIFCGVALAGTNLEDELVRSLKKALARMTVCYPELAVSREELAVMKEYKVSPNCIGFAAAKMPTAKVGPFSYHDKIKILVKLLKKHQDTLAICDSDLAPSLSSKDMADMKAAGAETLDCLKDPSGKSVSSRTSKKALPAASSGESNQSPSGAGTAH